MVNCVFLVGARKTPASQGNGRKSDSHLKGSSTDVHVLLSIGLEGYWRYGSKISPFRTRFKAK